MKLSIVTSLYCSSPYINDFYLRISDSIRRLPAFEDSYEIIFVNDGSPDDSLDKVMLLSRVDEHVRVVDLSRNFGHHKALITGVQRSLGEYVFLIDCDLEEPPELLEVFFSQMTTKPEVDMVFGVQEIRRGNWLSQNLDGMFYKVFNLLSETKVPCDQIIARLMRRSYVNSLVQFTETDLILVGVCQLAGHKQASVKIKKGYKKTTTYGWSRKLSILLDAITSFSARPLELIFAVGLLSFSVSILAIVWLIVSKMLVGSLIGWTSLCASIWLLGGLLLMAQGVIGLYMAKIFRQVKGRPFSIVRYDSYLDTPIESSTSSSSDADEQKSKRAAADLANLAR